MQMGDGGGKYVRCGGQTSDDKRWVGERSMLSSNHSFIGTCLNLLSWDSQGITKTELSKWTFHKPLTEKKFKQNKYKKEECHKPYISSFGNNNYKNNLVVPPVVINWRLCNIKVVTNWVPSEDILDLHQSFSSCYVLTYAGWREGRRGTIREKKMERLIPSWGATIKSPCQPNYFTKALLPNTITLAVKGGHNSTHSIA